MRWELAYAWLVLGGALLVGCQSGSRHSYSGDPLLLSKKPVEGKAGEPAPVLLAQAEPQPPSYPVVALPSPQTVDPELPPPKPETTAELPAPPPSSMQPIGTAKEPVMAIPAVRSSGTGGVAAVPAVARKVDGLFGRAANYSWLQGVLDRHYRGHLSLRYCDSSQDDPWGGKVLLEDDPRLAPYEDGAVLQVEGEIVGSSNPTEHGAWEYYPHYRIREVRLIQHAP